MKKFCVLLFLPSAPLCLCARSYFENPMLAHAKRQLMQQIKQGADSATTHQQIKELEAISQPLSPQYQTSESYSSTSSVVQKLDSINYDDGFYKYSYKYDWYDDPNEEIGDVFFNLNGHKLPHAEPRQVIINGKQQ